MSAVSQFAVAQNTPLAGRRVLIVEDEYFLADELTRALRGVGAEIIGPTAEIDEAWQLLNAAPSIDGALLDINLRSEMAFPLARELRARRVPFAFTTGYDKASVPAEFQDVPRFEKPLDVAAVVEALVERIHQRLSKAAD